MAIRRWLSAACLAGGVALSGMALAQDDSNVPAADGSSEKASGEFARLHEQWAAFDAELTKMAGEYRAAKTVDEKRSLLAAYKARVEEAGDLVQRLREAALTEYRSQPNADAKVSETLVGLLQDALRRDRVTQAREIADLLVENKCDAQQLADLAGQAAYCSDDFAAARAHFDKAKSAKTLSARGERYMADLDEAEKAWAAESQSREAEAAADDLPRVAIETIKGRIVIELFENEAPETVGNFISLVDKKFYDGLTFHRVLGNFMAQGGCPKGDGTGGPGYTIYCECKKENARKHFRGSLSMAHAGKDTGGSQFFLTFERTPFLDGKHTVFGRVIEGLDVLAEIQRRDPENPRALATPDRIVKAETLRKREHEYKPNESGKE